ncbi:hypothetical protein BKA65DRAFT_495719 [Rhexocercosporidium sp. MPI-PUGE-AT-0058]|nr:hypothetical protein BKA65DRAFT_495719 [Rhexocercosporidium sp. MPI-PUGE-AT-0058]
MVHSRGKSHPRSPSRLMLWMYSLLNLGGWQSFHLHFLVLYQKSLFILSQHPSHHALFNRSFEQSELLNRPHIGLGT